MRLNHLNLCVTDPAQARDFFQTNLGFRVLDQRGDGLVVMSDQNGFTLVLMRAKTSEGQTSLYPSGFHLGFLRETVGEVDAMHELMKAASIVVPHVPRKVHGSYGFYFTALDGILIEVSCPMSA